MTNASAKPMNQEIIFRVPQPDVAVPLQRIYNAVVSVTLLLVKQIELYRRMTGEQRLSIALDLHELSCDVAREGIRRQHPNADEQEIERLLRRRLELARAA